MLKTGRTAENTTLQTWELLLLGVLVFVLSIHFLFDDIAFSSVHNLPAASVQNQSEIAHQDDIVQYTELASQIPAKPAIQVTPLLVTEKLQVFFPAFNPPNI